MNELGPKSNSLRACISSIDSRVIGGLSIGEAELTCDALANLRENLNINGVSPD